MPNDDTPHRGPGPDDGLFDIPPTPGLNAGSEDKADRPTGPEATDWRRAAWRHEDDDPSKQGRGYPPTVYRRGAGCLALIVLFVGLIVTAFFFLPEHRVALLIAAGVLAMGSAIEQEVHAKRIKGRYGPPSYGNRDGWTASAVTPRQSTICRRIRGCSQPLILATSGFPTIEHSYDVRRSNGTGHAATTADFTESMVVAGGRRSVHVGQKMFVWVDLPAQLPALQVLNVRVVPEFATESIEFNNRYTVGRARIPSSLAWDKSEMSRYVSDVINPRMMTHLVDAFSGFPSILIFGDAIGAEIKEDAPYHAELTIDLLLDLVPLIPAFLYERYAAQAARDAAHQ